MKTLHGKTVLLTGAAAGIGRELALQLSKLGTHLYLVDVDHEGLQRLRAEIESRGGKVWIRQCDLSRADDVELMLADFDSQTDVIDVLINNAGVAYYGPTEEMSAPQWDWLMNINLLTPIRITTHLLPQLLERPESHVANMCSIAGLVAGGRFSAYHTSKFGLVGFTESLRAEYGRKGVGVSAICPGPVLTKLYESAASGRPDGTVPVPPKWASATPEAVARLTISAIQKNKRQVLITPMAHAVSRLKRFVPGLLDLVSQFSRNKKKRMAERQAREDERLRLVANTESGRTPVARPAA